MLLLWRSKILSSISLGTFVKHLSTWNPHCISFKFKFHSNEKLQSFATAAQLTSLFQTLTSQQQQQVDLYIHSLLQWNQNMNLTAVKDENDAMERHVEDSLAIVEPIRSSYLSHCGTSCENLNVIDVGSGAGLPGLILAIACPGWKVTLLESMHKRCVFLKHAVGVTALSNVQVIRERAENLGHDPGSREMFDVAVARAVAEMRTLVEYCLPLVRVGGLFVAAKGHNPQKKLAQMEKELLGYESIDLSRPNIANELKVFLQHHLLPLGKDSRTGITKIVASVGHSCEKSMDLLFQYMNYKVNGPCPDDWSLGQKLILRGCEPLPRRRYFAKVIPKEEVKRAERAIKLMRASVLRTCTVKSHSKYGQRTAIICLKEGTTPRKYPRDPGTPGKSPL